MYPFSLRELHRWCSIPFSQLETHVERKTPFRLVKDATEMAEMMARVLVDEITDHNRSSETTRAIVPCGPTGWYKPFTQIVNSEGVTLKNFIVFHMDECLDWQGRLLPKNHPLNFRTFMERHFYGDIRPELAVPQAQRHFPTPNNIQQILDLLWQKPIDITIGGWGQDGHIAYNQARRDPFIRITMEDLENSTLRIQENNVDTVIAIAQRNFGTAYQFVPPMSLTLGVKECLSAKKVRVFSDTGAWKQTALRIALFGPITIEYPMTLLQKHSDALITATIETARHPFSEHPEWDFFSKSDHDEE